jgi:hypothetical protein
MDKKIIVGMLIAILVSTSVVSAMNQDTTTLKIPTVTPLLKAEAIQQETQVTCYTTGKTGSKHLTVTIPTQTADRLYTVFQQLKEMMTAYPFSEKTQHLKQEFITLLAENNLIPTSITPDQYSSLLNPPWFETLRKNHDKFSSDIPIKPAAAGTAAAFFCSMGGEGVGFLFPFIMLPRPRLIMSWTGLDGEIMVGKLLSIGGFLAEGAQFGIALGFWGIGLAFAFPYGTFYGFAGYALFASATATYMERYPPDYPPEIIDINPEDGAVNVPESLSELSFSITDPSGDLMSYTVTTTPDIGSGSGNLKLAGTYSIPIQGLQESTQYKWTLKVSDDVQTIQETFTFTTEAITPIISNPQPADGEKDVPINLPMLQFTLKDYQGDTMEYTVQTSPDIGSKHETGVHDGTYSVPVSGMMYGTIYRWYVNVTDGTHWARKSYVFSTGYPSPFDPFEYGWQYRKQIIIDHTQVAGDLEEFPVLIKTIDPDLTKAQADGDDILFMNGVGNSTKLHHELEVFDQATGTLTAWVNVPALTSEQDTVFYLYYGNPGCINQEYPEKVWNTHYKAVWHLDTNPLDGVIDSTLNNHDGTAQGDMTVSDVDTGKIGSCLDFDGIDDLISFSEFTDALDIGTCIAWVHTTSSDLGAVWGEANMDSDKPYIMFGKYSDDFFSYARDIYGSDSNYQGCKSTGINDGFWHQVAWLSKGSGNGNVFYFDGQPISLIWQDEQDPNGIWFDDQSTDTHSIGGLNRLTNDYQWTGMLDEIRITDTPLSAEWITTEYTNQNNPAGFLTIGPEEPGL